MTNSTSSGPPIENWIYRNHVAALMMLLALGVVVGTLTTKGLQHARVKPEHERSEGAIAARREVVNCPLVAGPSVLPTPTPEETEPVTVEIVPRARS